MKLIDLTLPTFAWFDGNSHKPDVNKNYLLSVANLLLKISRIEDIKERTLFVLFLIEDAMHIYEEIENKYIILGGSESKNYHLSTWKQCLLESIQLRPSDFLELYDARIK